MGILKKINTACRIVKEEGMYVMLYKFKAKLGIGSAGENAGIASNDEKNYKNWIKKNETDLYKFDESKIPYKPLISVVDVKRVYNVCARSDICKLGTLPC